MSRSRVLSKKDLIVDIECRRAKRTYANLKPVHFLHFRNYKARRAGRAEPGIPPARAITPVVMVLIV